MKVELVNVSRRPPWPPWAILMVLIWSGLGVGVVWLSFHYHYQAQLCLLRNLTGISCPTCGFTRGVLSFLNGRILQAWLYNPLLFSTLGLFFILTAFRIFFAHSIRLSLTKRERSLAWVAAIILFITNWMYVAIRDIHL